MIDDKIVQQILSTADVVDVVSDFVSLRRRGSNWVGLCPFHNDRTPSFYVSRNKQLYKCFSCGEAGSAVSFVMKHEQMTYPEALRYLAGKYHIEIAEREMTDEERQAKTERESMLIINEWACQWMEDRLWNSADGQEIGLSYFRERGFTDATIRKFRLGYSPDARDALFRDAIRQGYNAQLLFSLGLCKDDDRGGGYDFYRGRVMFPIFSVSGRVIAFGGRTLRKDDRAKYFNSPDSSIYDKSNSTMYGLYQAKRAIAQQKKCFIVEGYADVISMHQAGFENVIASSGTALTDGHIQLLSRFTDNVTELFDGDEAGIRAAMKGIDKLLARGLNIKVLLLPDGEDPDSYSRRHSSSEIQQYIDLNESDFIQFKTRILLDGTAGDPTERARAITEVVKSIAVIPDPITRSVYAKECSRLFEMSEEMLLREIDRNIRANKEEAFKQRERERQRNIQTETEEDRPRTSASSPITHQALTGQPTYREECDMIRLVVKYGMCHLCETAYQGDEVRPVTLVEYLYNELTFDKMQFEVPVFREIFDVAMGLLGRFYALLPGVEQSVQQHNEVACLKQLEQIDPVGKSAELLDNEEKRIRSKFDEKTVEQVNEFRQSFLERQLCSHSNDTVRETASQLVSERHQLSKIFTQETKLPSDIDRLPRLVDAALYNWKNAIVRHMIDTLSQQLQQAASQEQARQLLLQLQELYELRSKLALLIGERVVNP